MLRERIVAELSRRPEGLTIEQLEQVLAVPRATLRSVLTKEFYLQSEIEHVQYGKMTVWSVKPSVIRLADDRLLLVEPVQS